MNHISSSDPLRQSIMFKLIKLVLNPNYGRIGSGLDGIELPRGSNCKTSPLNSLGDSSSSCNGLQLITPN